MAKRKRLRVLPHPFRVHFATDAVPEQLKDHRYDEDSGRRPGFVLAWHRQNTEAKQCAVANEWICAHIAQAIGLEFPPFGITRSDDPKTFYFSELDFNADRDTPPRTDAEACIQHQPFVSTGILLFDILIANPDRRPGNLEVDHVTKPRRIWVFDCEQAMFGHQLNRAATRLSTLRERLGLAYLHLPDTNYHCFLDRLNTKEHFDDWFDRISGLQNWFLKEVCQETRLFGMDNAASQEASDFLIHRRNRLREIVNSHRELFTGIEWSPPGELSL